MQDENFFEDVPEDAFDDGDASVTGFDDFDEDEGEEAASDDTWDAESYAAEEGDEVYEPQKKDRRPEAMQEKAAPDGEGAGEEPLPEPAREEPCAEATVVSKGCTVGGCLLSDGLVKVYGRVEDSLKAARVEICEGGCALKGAEATESVEVFGRCNGPVVGQKTVEVRAGGFVLGPVKGFSVSIGDGGVVIGAVEAAEVRISGAVKGSVSAKGRVVLEPTAIVQGNVTGESIAIGDGAAINGSCTQTGANEKPARFFEELLKEDRK